MNAKFKVDRSGLKLASFLKEALPESYSAKLIKKTIEKGCCRLNGKVTSYASTLVKKGDQIEISISLPVKISLEIVYEDEHLMIINKPQGVVSESASLKAHIKTPFYLVHRLDKETTGLLILAKTQSCKKALELMFKEKLISKQYLALCDGVFQKESGVIEVGLKAQDSTKHALIMKVDPMAFHKAKTLWKKICVSKEASLIEFDLITGKTHQIRVHAAHVGHGILGDPVYLQRPICRYVPSGLLLHAYHISFKHPITDQLIDVKKALPEPFLIALKQLMPHAKLPCN
jgi:RluA family pseudouridine synthase